MDNNQQGVQLIESEEDKKKKTAQSQPGSAFGGAQTSPTGAKPSPTGPVAPSAAQQTRAVQEAGPSKGTGFTGVGRYLQANVGSRLGEKVAGRVAQTGQQAATRLGQSVQQFQQQLGTRPTEPGQQGTGLYGQLSSQQQAAQEALRKISSGELTNVSPEQQAAYAAVAGGQFRAPTGLTDIGDIQSQAQLAGKLAQGTQTAAGRAGLLQQVVGRGPQQYTKGKSALDALILGQAGGELAAARRATAGLERQATTQEQLAAEKARQFGAEMAGAQSSLTGEVAGIEKRTGAEIAAQKEKYEKGVQDLIKKIQEQVPTGRVSPELAEYLSSYGISPGTRIYDQDFSALARFIESSKTNPADLITSANAQQIAQLNALAKISGKASPFSSEQLKTAGTTLDPLTGLNIDKTEFTKKFVEPGVKKISDAIKSHIEDITSQDYYSGFIDKKPIDASAFFDAESNRLDEKAIEAAIKRYKQEADDYAYVTRSYNPAGAPSAKYAQQLQSILDYYRSGKVFEEQLSNK